MIAVLEDLLSKNSRNSNKPSSTDSPYKYKIKNKNRTTNTPKKRTGTTLKQVSNPDKVVFSKVTECEHCKTSLIDSLCTDFDKRQVTDIPPIQAYVTEYQGEITVCPLCNEITKAKFPEGITHKAQYGKNIQAMAVYLRNYQLILLNRTLQLFKDLFNISISEGTLVNMTKRCADGLSGFIETVKEQLRQSDVIHNDETGINIDGQLHWIQTAGNKELTYLLPHKKKARKLLMKWVF